MLWIGNNGHPPAFSVRTACEVVASTALSLLILQCRPLAQSNVLLLRRHHPLHQLSGNHRQFGPDGATKHQNIPYGVLLSQRQCAQRRDCERNVIA